MTAAAPDIIEKMKTSPIKPWKVIMHNDDITTFEFVVDILQTIFGHKQNQANITAALIHTTGQAIVGVYSREVAELKIEQCHSKARARKYPLTCSMES